MYIECKAGNLTGPARIGLVTYSKTLVTIYYRGRQFRKLKGFKANDCDVDSGEEYWNSGPGKDGLDALYETNIQTEIDGDARRILEQDKKAERKAQEIEAFREMVQFSSTALTQTACHPDVERSEDGGTLQRPLIS